MSLSQVRSGPAAVKFLATQAIIATVITIAGLCDALQDDTGLVAAITMGMVLANLRGVVVPEDRPFLKTVVQLAIGVLFISISATVTPASLRGVIWPTLGLVALLVLVVRPAVAVVATVRTSLTRNERIFVGSMDPRGIVAASTAASFSAPLVALGIAGASKLLAATFLVIVGTVAIYGLAAAPLARALGLREPGPDKSPQNPRRPLRNNPLNPPGETTARTSPPARPPLARPPFHLGENDGQVVTGHLPPRNRRFVSRSQRRAAQPGAGGCGGCRAGSGSRVRAAAFTQRSDRSTRR